MEFRFLCVFALTFSAHEKFSGDEWQNWWIYYRWVT